jgi:flagellar hook-associated protein 2
MAGISLSGLASGMDWKSIVTQLMALERAPQDKAKAKVAALATRQTALDSVKTSLLALQTAAKALSFGTGATSPRSAAVQGTTTDATVTTADGATVGTYTVSVGGTSATNSLLRDAAGALVGATTNTGPASASNLYGTSGAFADVDGSALRALTLADYGVTAGTVTLGGASYTIATTDLTKTISQFFGVSALGASGAPLFNGAVVAASPSFGVSQSSVAGATYGALTLSIADPVNSFGSPGDTSNLLSAMGFSVDAATIGAGTLTTTQSIPSAALGKLKVSAVNGGLGAAENLVINGVNVGPFDASLATGTLTFGAIVTAINQKTSTGVTAAIDPTHQRIVLTSTVPGRNGIVVDTAALGGTLGLSSGGASLAEVATDPGAGAGWFQRGKALEFNLKFNGQTVVDSTGSAVLTSDTNVVDLSKYGFGNTKITLSPSVDLTNLSSAASYTAVVSGATSAVKAKVDTFVAAYNSLRQLVSDSTKITVSADGKVTTSVLSDNKDIVTLSNTLRSNIFATVTDAANSSLSTSYNSISKIGLGFDRYGVMSVTSATTLDAALTNAPTAVDALLNALGTSSTATTTQGVGTRVSYIADRLTATTGLFPSLTTSISSQTLRLKKQIESLGRSLAAKQKTLENSFIAMERAQSQFQQQASALTQAFSKQSSN